MQAPHDAGAARFAVHGRRASGAKAPPVEARMQGASTGSLQRLTAKMKVSRAKTGNSTSADQAM